jgi:hypothetical protein
MRTVFYLLTSILIISNLALADAPPLAAVEEVPVQKNEASQSDTTKELAQKSSDIKAKLPTSSARPTAPSTSNATEIISAKGEKLAIATGHYARARALLISALREFDKGLELVDPNALVDVNLWRNSILDRAEDLERILDPQPRKSRGGVRFDDSTAKTGDAGALRKKN